MSDKLTPWLTVPEAAQHLTRALGKDITSAYVLRVGLIGQLKLSVHFPNLAQARRYVAPDCTEEYEEHLQIVAARAAGLPDPVFDRRPPTPLEEECARVVVLREEVYDLPMVGGEKLDVEQEYQRQTGGPEVTLTAFDGTFVDSEDGIRYQLCKEDLTAGTSGVTPPDLPYYLEANVEPYRSPNSNASYDRLLRLPSDSVLVVRTAALDDFIARTIEPADETQAHSPERRPAVWKDVTIEFTSDERVQISVGPTTYTQNFSEMGFEDRRNGKPNKAWLTLSRLAAKDGTILVTIEGRERAEKRMQEVRKTLRAHFAKEHFEIPSEPDPLPYDSRGRRYSSLFKIGTRPSVRT